jgi:hypothetical protein
MDLASLYVIGLTAGWLRDRRRRQEEVGERIRNLKSLGQVIKAVQEDLGSSIPAVRGVLISLEPFRDRLPALGETVRALDHSLSPIESLTGQLRVLSVDSKVRLVSLDRVLLAAEGRMRMEGMTAPSLTLDWRCTPPTIPASVGSLSSSLAALILHMGAEWPEVKVTISKSTGWVILNLSPQSTRQREVSPSTAPTSASFEVARQIIAAHGGKLENGLDRHQDPYVRIHVPSTLQISAVLRESIGRKGRKEYLSHRAADRSAQPRPEPLGSRDAVTSSLL